MPKPSSTTARESLGAFSTAASSRRTSVDVEDHRRIVSRRASQRTAPPQTLEIAIPPRDVDSIERAEPVSTPLLPPMMDKQFNTSTDELQSPLQEPTVAPRQMTDSWVLTPNSTTFRHPSDVLTPPLSTKNSMASLQHSVVGNDLASLSLAAHRHQPSQREETDPYSAALGHANFTIHPAPYYPPADEPITALTCQRLLADWEAARKHYLRCAADISRDYGPTSTTFHHAERKWAALDAQWRAHHARALAAALHHAHCAGAAAGDDDSPLPPALLLQQSLAAPSAKSLHAAAEAVCAPEALHAALAQAQRAAEAKGAGAAPPKFPCVAREEMVGSMVQYARRAGGDESAKLGGEEKKTRKQQPVLLRIFTDPKSLLFGDGGAR